MPRASSNYARRANTRTPTPQTFHCRSNVPPPFPLSLLFGRRTLDALSLGGQLLNAEKIQRIPWERLKVIDVSLEDIVAQNALIEIYGPARHWRRRRRPQSQALQISSRRKGRGGGSRGYHR